VLPAGVANLGGMGPARFYEAVARSWVLMGMGAPSTCVSRLPPLYPWVQQTPLSPARQRSTMRSASACPSSPSSRCVPRPPTHPRSHHPIPSAQWDPAHPDDRTKWGAQHEALKHLGPPHVYNVFKDDADGLERAVRAALDAPLLDWCVVISDADVLSCARQVHSPSDGARRGAGAGGRDPRDGLTQRRGGGAGRRVKAAAEKVPGASGAETEDEVSTRLAWLGVSLLGVDNRYLDAFLGRAIDKSLGDGLLCIPLITIGMYAVEHMVRHRCWEWDRLLWLSGCARGHWHVSQNSANDRGTLGKANY
jgi:hypothetical protein